MSDVSLHKMKKEDVVHALLAQGMAMIHLDPRKPGVNVPDHLLGSPTLRLNISYKFQIPDFTVDAKGIVCSLHFPEVGNFRCVIPWDAIYGATSQVSNDGRMWMESMPIEIRLDLARRAVMLLGQMRNPAADAPSIDAPAEGEAEASEELAPQPPGPQLRVITGGAEERREAAESEDEPPTPKPRPKLRLVK